MGPKWKGLSREDQEICINGGISEGFLGRVVPEDSPFRGSCIFVPIDVSDESSVRYDYSKDIGKVTHRNGMSLMSTTTASAK